MEENLPDGQEAYADSNSQQTLPTILTCAAWIPMVSAQSLVLYSRLHLINLNDTVRRWVLMM